MYVVYRALLTVIHLVYSCLETFLYIWCYVRKKYDNLCCKKELKDEFYYISNCVRNIKTIPSHLAFILINEEIISFEDLANLVLWSLAAGVSFVSFYDHNGLLKRCEAKLIAEVSRRGCYGEALLWGTTPSNNGKIHSNGACCGPSHTRSKNGITNGFKTQRQLRVVLLSREDGRDKLAKTATLLAEEPRAQGVDGSIAQTDRVLRKLYQKEGPEGAALLPDPELAVWCGSVSCNAGFLPWHIRITEFLQLRSHRNITVQQFTSLLYRYSKCEQRYGK